MSVTENLKKVWNKTIFPDMIKEKKAKKAEEKQLREEARREALEEYKPLLKEKYKKEELAKLMGDKSNSKLSKLAKGFGIEEGNNNKTTGNDMSKKITDAFSFGGGSDDYFSDNKISKMLGSTKQPRKNNKGKQETPEDKIKRMLG